MEKALEAVKENREDEYRFSAVGEDHPYIKLCRLTHIHRINKSACDRGKKWWDAECTTQLDAVRAAPVEIGGAETKPR